MPSSPQPPQSAPPPEPAGPRFERVVEIMHRLRAPGGCPWDREQTFDSIKPYTLEETYEVLDAIDQRDWKELSGELGDLLLQVLFYAEMAAEQGHFSIHDVLDRLAEKLVSRHPHVFGDVEAHTSEAVLRNWEALKSREKKEKKDKKQPGESAKSSVLSGISQQLPALMQAYKISSRAANIGFDWPDIEGLFDKLNEETAELRAEVKQAPTPLHGAASSRGAQVPEVLRARMEDEVGDMFFVLVNIARYLSLDPESALRKSNRKFVARFQHMEQQAEASGRALAGMPIVEMEALWQEAKRQERSLKEKSPQP